MISEVECAKHHKLGLYVCPVLLTIAAELVTYYHILSVFRKHETTQIREEETFSSKRCLEWFYEYAGEFLNVNVSLSAEHGWFNSRFRPYSDWVLYVLSLE